MHLVDILSKATWYFASNMLATGKHIYKSIFKKDNYSQKYAQNCELYILAEYPYCLNGNA